MVDDVGANRGILIAESGCQPGAHAAAQSTNIELLTLAELRSRAKAEMLYTIFRKLDETVAFLLESAHDLFIFERETAKHHSLGYRGMARPRSGIDAQAIYSQIGRLAILELGMRRVKAGRFPAVLGFTNLPHEEAIVAHDLEEFIDKAGNTIDEVDKWLKVQERVVRKLEGYQ